MTIVAGIQEIGRYMAVEDFSVPTTADVVVVGGGIVGMSTALQLAKRGAGTIVVLERRKLGAGATGKSGALLRCHYPNTPEARLAAESLRIFANWSDEVGAGSPAFEQVGFIQLVAPEDEKLLRANVAALHEIGVDTDIVTADELRDIEPLLRTDDVTYGAYEPNSGCADPNGALYGMAEAAGRLGVTIATDTQATELVIDSGRITGVATAAGTIATRAVVVAAGAWSDSLFRPLGLDLGLVPVRTQVALFRWPADIGRRRTHAVVIDDVRHSWIRPEAGCLTLAGGGLGIRPTDPDTFDETLDGRILSPTRELLEYRFPAFSGVTMRGGWAGTYMRSPDGHPIIDQVPEVPGLWIMTGDSGSSFKTAPAIGICLAEWITDGTPKLVDLTPFRASRFREGQPWIDTKAYPDRRTPTTTGGLVDARTGAAAPS